jgi:hypothetical protein
MMEQLTIEVVDIATDLYNNQNLNPNIEKLSRDTCYLVAVGLQRNRILEEIDPVGDDSE